MEADILRARLMESSSRPRAETGALSQTAWERTLDQLRLRLKGRPSRTRIFGRAGLRNGKMYWMRRNPDLRASVVVKLSKALRVHPSTFFRLMYLEATRDLDGVIRF